MKNYRKYIATEKTTKQTLVEMVKQALAIIQHEAATFTHKAKANYDPDKPDLVTSADTKAQAHYVRALRREFPDYGLIGEEDGLCDVKENYFTIDPLDGTKAFARKQSHGAGSMLAMVEGKDVVAAYVADINTGDIYGYSKEDGTATRVRFGVESPMMIDTTIPINRKYVTLCDPIHRYPVGIQKIVKSMKDGGLFKDYEVMGGSIGTNVARLWKDEVAMMVLVPSFDTPWDTTPIIGINRKLGIKHLMVDVVTGKAKVFEPDLPLEVRRKDFVEIMVHESRVEEILRKLN